MKAIHQVFQQSRQNTLPIALFHLDMLNWRKVTYGKSDTKSKVSGVGWEGSVGHFPHLKEM